MTRLNILEKLKGRDMQVSVMPSVGDWLPWLDRVRNLAVATGLKKMVEEDHFSICDLRKLLRVARIVPDGDVMEVLECLHCVDYAKMPVELRQELARIIAELFQPTVRGEQE